MDGNLLVGSFPLFAEDDKSSSHSSTTFNRHHRRQHQTRNSEFKPNSDVSRMALEPKKTVVAGDSNTKISFRPNIFPELILYRKSQGEKINEDSEDNIDILQNDANSHNESTEKAIPQTPNKFDSEERVNMTQLLSRLDDIQHVLDETFTGRIENEQPQSSKHSNSPPSETRAMAQQIELDDGGINGAGDQHKQEEVFVCNITEHTSRHCSNENVFDEDLEAHINTLIAVHIKHLRQHVRGLKNTYKTEYYMYEDDELDSEDNKMLETKRNGSFQISSDEQSVLNTAYTDLVKTACYLHKSRDDSKLYGEMHADNLSRLLNGANANGFYTFLCNMRQWMNAVNGTISDIVVLEKTENFEANLVDHIRRQWDFTILSSLTEYLNILEGDLQIIQKVKYAKKLSHGSN